MLIVGVGYTPTRGVLGCLTAKGGEVAHQVDNSTTKHALYPSWQIDCKYVLAMCLLSRCITCGLVNGCAYVAGAPVLELARSHNAAKGFRSSQV